MSFVEVWIYVALKSCIERQKNLSHHKVHSVSSHSPLQQITFTQSS